MTQTVYVPVEASGVNTYAVNIPSGADTTSGYYLSYNVGGGVKIQDLRALVGT